MSSSTKISIALFSALTLAGCGPCEDDTQREIEDSKREQVELKLSIFPEDVAIGDTCYVTVTAINHSEEYANVWEPSVRYPGFPIMVHFNLKYHDIFWRGTFEMQVQTTAHPGSQMAIPIPDGESVTFLAVPLQFPPLEDLYRDAFWQEIGKELKDNPNGLSLDFGIEFLGVAKISELLLERNKMWERTRLTKKVTVKFRNNTEMAMIDQWFQSRPENFYPVIHDSYNYPIKAPALGLDRFREPYEVGIHFGYYLRYGWIFTNSGNRYPGNLGDLKTWQDWKELEESITPSTMRDEIRLTRIMLQYCDTKEVNVLDELTEWFDGMNEIQRTVMAKSIRERAEYSEGDLLVLFRTIYTTIRDYDVVPIPGHRVERLQSLGLIE